MRERRRSLNSLPRRRRGPQDLVVMLDGTLSTLDPQWATNIGQIFHVLSAIPARQRPCIYYEPGLQFDTMRDSWSVMAGVGLNRQIARAYGWLASRYRPGDRIFLLGYSRGAFAVRSLAGIIDQIGLLKSRAATERNVRDIYRHYRIGGQTPVARRFAKSLCHWNTPIEMVGVFDTVKALGLRLPILNKLSEAKHSFHYPELSHNVSHGYHALALHETRQAFCPVLWRQPEGWTGRVEQMWFRGTHGDIGGQLSHFAPARQLSNIPLSWMLEKIEGLNIALPSKWRAKFPCDADAPSSGNFKGWGKVFLLRRRRIVGMDGSEKLHSSIGSHLIPRGVDLPLGAVGA
ncbi:MAG: DUF2235 domain-containing protein [Mangrovicoccus sp.]